MNEELKGKMTDPELGSAAQNPICLCLIKVHTDLTYFPLYGNCPNNMVNTTVLGCRYKIK